LKTIISEAIYYSYEQLISDISACTSWLLAQSDVVRNKSSPLAVQWLADGVLRRAHV